ncbi:MAG: 4-hydroxyphenylacetate 3-hydroxylase N-terminal domain-containing protein [Emcibacteraceae bacterium]|nr:4-hydroxyphenylacetate 3-hydroxylase N-terminal domain-containing protein [Emcibacteraceae bacterium]
MKHSFEDKLNMTAGRGHGIMTGAEYKESLQDGREVWVQGEKVEDVTKHPAFERVINEMARIYQLQHEADSQDTMSFVNDDGVRISYSYSMPKNYDDLMKRRDNTAFWAKESLGMFGRFPDFCAAMIVGMYDTRDEMAKIDPRFKTNIENYLKYASENDLSLSHGLHDPAMDKSQRPREDPDRCLRIVEEREDGIIVRGARFVTLGPLTDEVVLAPTQGLQEDEPEFGLWFAMPVCTPGIRQVCREPFSINRNPRDHKLSTRFDEQDVVMIFDDVFVPWERVFLANAPKEANILFRSRVMRWAAHCSVLQLLARMELMIGVAHLMTETEGKGGRQLIDMELGELVTYKEIFRSIIRTAEYEGSMTKGGHFAIKPAPHLRALIGMISERLVSIIEHVTTSSALFVPSAEDMDVPELRPLIDRYWRGKGVDAEYRQKLSKLAWELTGDSFGGRQQLYERLHSGSPEVIVASVYKMYDKTAAIAMVEDALAYEG